jgi:hypothetical protein
MTKRPSFGVKDGTIEFLAIAAYWWRSTALYVVKVYWIEDMNE